MLCLLAPALPCCATSGGHARSANATHDDDNTSGDDESTSEPEEKPAPKPANSVFQAAGDPKRVNFTKPEQGDDVHAVLQLAIDDTELDQYLKLGEPGRFPLKIAGSAVPQNIELVKATKPVVVTTPPSSKSDPVLVITDVDITGTSATVSYRYDVEGIRGTAFLKKTPHGWELTSSRIVEH